MPFRCFPVSRRLSVYCSFSSSSPLLLFTQSTSECSMITCPPQQTLNSFVLGFTSPHVGDLGKHAPIANMNSTNQKRCTPRTIYRREAITHNDFNTHTHCKNYLHAHTYYLHVICFCGHLFHPFLAAHQRMNVFVYPLFVVHSVAALQSNANTRLHVLHVDT